MKSEFFMNVTQRGLTVHLLRGASPRCRGKRMIPARIEDMARDGEVEIINDKPYRIWVCRNCVRRLRLFETAAYSSSQG